MPLIHVNLIENVFDESEKRRVIEGITDVMESVKGKAFRDVVLVMVHEVPSGNVGKAGNILTTEKVRELVATA